MVRHGKAAAGFDGHLDPGLDELGRAQAFAVADELSSKGPLPVYASPLARARETAEPLARRWGVDIQIESRVAEIPSPTQVLAERVAWLRQAMQGRWRDLDSPRQRWRQALVDYLTSVEHDSVVFCHYIAINVAVGAATGDDRVVIFPPDNGSVTVLSNAGGRLSVLALGRSASTAVN
jgi:broad specificity phosphatase PhoE